MEKAVPLVWEIDTGVATKQFLEQWNGQWQGRQLDTPDAETLKEMERLVYRRIELLPAGRARISKFSDPSVGGGPRLASAIYGATRQGNEVILTAPQTLPPAFFWERDLRGNGTMVLRILNRTKALLLSRSPDGVYSARSILRPAGGRK